MMYLYAQNGMRGYLIKKILMEYMFIAFGYVKL